MQRAASLFAIISMLAGAAFAAPAMPPGGEVSAGRGPYQVVMYADPGLPNHIIYRPVSLARVRGPLPIVAWGNGGCEANGNRYRHFLADVASRGFLVIAIGKMGPAAIESEIPAEPVIPDTPPDINAPAASEPGELTTAIDWAVAQNAKGGKFAGRIDTHHVAVLGHSCGGMQALAVAGDPRVSTVMLLDSGVWTKGTGGLPGARVTKADLARVHTPIAYISGDRADVAFDNANDDFARLKSVPVLRAYRIGTEHKGTFWTAPNGGDFARVTGAWLEWQLKGDRHAARLFVGKACGLCSDPNWRVAKKNIP